MSQDFTKNVYYKLTEVKMNRDNKDLLAAIRFKDEEGNEFAWWPKLTSLYEILGTIIAIQKQYKDNRKGLKKIMDMLEGEP